MPKYHSAAAREIGRRLRDARNRRGVSLEDLGHLSDVNWTTIGKIERGASSPTVETLVRVASALQIDAGALISGISADEYGNRTHPYTALDFIEERSRREQDRSSPSGKRP